MTVITRFAPSPTGPLHLGGARTALFNWLYARHNKGKFILRFEDTDTERSSEDFATQIKNSLLWLGMNWDGDILYQSSQLPLYQTYADKLLKSDHAYKKDGALYFKSTLSEFEDFVIIKSNGYPVFHFAVVIDDALQGVTHAIRGDDHLTNTRKHEMIFKALGLSMPQYIHVPLICGTDGKPLSKRDHLSNVLLLQQQEYLPEAVVNFIVRLGWAYKDQEFFSMNDLTDKFSLEGLGKSAGIVNQEKLEWLNTEHIKTMDIHNLIDRYFKDIAIDNLVQIINLHRTRAQSIPQLRSALSIYTESAITISEEAKPLLDSTLPRDEIKKTISQITPWQSKHIEEVLRAFAQEKTINTKVLFQSLRVMITGQKVSPPLFDVMELVGKERVLQRI